MKKIIIVSLLLLIYIFISIYSYVYATSTSISNSVFRLHIIANSDSSEDQALKLKIRDSILSYMNSLIPDNCTKETSIAIASEHLNDFYDIANEIVCSEGYSYPINITIGQYDFPTKEYGDISLPAGIYDALRIEIGSAAGHNWWCVMFPPLCFVDITSGIVPDDSKQQLKDSMSSEEYDIITSDNNSSDITFKFKLIEWIENIKMELAKL